MCWKECGKIGTLVLCWWECKMVQLLQPTARLFLRNIELTYDLPIPLQGIGPKELKTGTPTDICTPMIITFLFPIAKRWKQTQCPLPHEWINKMWYVYTMGHYQALKRKEILTYATTWMNHEDIMLSETSQMQKYRYCIIPLI